MKICVISPGVVHAIPRTIAIADQFDEVHFIGRAGRHDREILESHGIVFHGPEEGHERHINNRQLQSILTQIEPDAIICHYASGDHFFTAIAYARCPVAVIAMGNDVLYDEGDTFISYFTRALIRASLRRAAYISAKSKHLAERIRGFGVKGPISVNYWGADLDRYKPGSRVEARRKLKLDENKTIILSPRAIEPRLNIHLIVEAFPAVLARHPEALLVVLGRSSTEYKERIAHMVDQMNLANNVCILDEVSPDILSLYIQASDVVVSVAHSEGFPNTMLEVMACKVPMVIGRITQVEELLEDGRNAWICQKDPQSIAGAILDVLEDKDKREKLSAAAYVTVKEHADIRKNGIVFSDNLKQVCTAGFSQSHVAVMGFRVIYGLYRLRRKLMRSL